jgi:hypothetical protein
MGFWSSTFDQLFGGRLWSSTTDQLMIKEKHEIITSLHIPILNISFAVIGNF